MSKIILEVKDSTVDKVLWFLEQLKDVVTIDIPQSRTPIVECDMTNDPIAQELQRRIQAVDDGTETLTLYSDGMDSMMERIRVK